MHSSSLGSRRGRLLAGTAIVGLAALLSTAHAQAGDNFDIPQQPLPKALAQFGAQSGFEIIADSTLTASKSSPGVTGTLDPDAALSHMLRGTGLTYRRDDGSYVILAAPPPRQFAEAAQPAHAAASVETVIVTSSKIKGDIQTVPIAITALSQEQLTSRQIAGGPDLVKEVPNLTFSKTNFSGYNLEIRGIGTQAISVSTDPAVAVALNDIPFIRNHFFEQEFFDVNQVEVLRGPQGTLYGRNATAGVVNVISAKPTDQFEAMLSADWGNYLNRRYEGMVNVPVVDDRLDIRVAGEWTKRNGYTINETTGDNVDGRDLWSSRVSIGVKPMANMQATLVWEHFQESDDRMRTAKQLCHTDPGLSSVDGVTVPASGSVWALSPDHLSQGCLPASLYSPQSFQVPDGLSLPYVVAGEYMGVLNGGNPYQSTTQSLNLRDIQTQINPRYDAKNNTLELNADYNFTPALTFTSQTGYNQDFLYSTEDYNRFDTTPGIFQPIGGNTRHASLLSPYTDCGIGAGPHVSDGTYYFDDPQLGCSNRLVAQDVSQEHAWQLSQEFRLASNFSGPLNFSVGGNYMHYETVENYYVFANTLTMFSAFSDSHALPAWEPGVSDDHECLSSATGGAMRYPGFQYNDPHHGAGVPTEECIYIDPNPLGSLNDNGHNYFLSKNPYVLNSYAGFGEAYYNVLSDLKLTGGIRWTDDQKHFIDIPSELLSVGYSYANIGAVDQQWNQLTGRFAADWTPKLDFTDQTLIYASYAHGYKAGGANPPGPVLSAYNSQGGLNGLPDHPLTFAPEFIDAYELGSKNTMLDGALTLNGDIFYYNYKGYQISEIVDRTSINLNFNAFVHGAELEASYEPLPGLKFNFAGGYEATKLADGSQAIDLIDRTAGHAGWVVVKPFVTQPSNCILPAYVVAALVQAYPNPGEGDDEAVSACGYAYQSGFDPYNDLPYDYTINPANGRALHPVAGYPGFDPLSVDPNAPAGVNEGQGLPPNDGEGFYKDLSGNQLPNAPHFTSSFSAEYTMPVSEDWAASLHGDFYWQSQSFARVFNDRPYDKIRGYSNVNLALILTSASGWQVMGYVKNIFDVTAITGTFLNSDDSGLTTNVFLTDPRLFGVRVTKNW